MKKILALAILTLLFLPPVVLGIQTYGPAVSIQQIVIGAEMAAGLIFGAIAVIMFVVAGIQFLTAQGDAEKIKTARAAFIWGVAGVAVGIIAFSIIALVGGIISSGGGGGGGGAAPCPASNPNCR